MSGTPSTGLLRGGLPQTPYEARLARDDARRIADKRDGGRTKELLVMLAALLDGALSKPPAEGNVRCARCGHHPADPALSGQGLLPFHAAGERGD